MAEHIQQPPDTSTGTTQRFLSKRDDIDAWFQQRTWSLSGEAHAAADSEYDAMPKSTAHCKAKTILFPKSTDDVSDILRGLPVATPVSVVCGGHSSANVSTVACDGAVIVDLQRLNTVEVDKDKMQITVGGGTTTKDLAEAVRDASGALPIGTGSTVGVAGYVLNGGISGYFQRRLGMLAQRVVRLTFVSASGDVKELLNDAASASEGERELLRAMLGAGAALGIVTSLTFQMEDERSFQTGGQMVVACGDLESAQILARKALVFLRDNVMANPSVSMELVVTADYTCVMTFVFYDTFGGNPSDFVSNIRKAGGDKVVVDEVMKWKSWFEAASCLWPVIAEMKGDPLMRMDHCMGSREAHPADGVLDFIVEKWISDMPFALADMSIVEIRSLGGAALERSDLVSAGNAECQFFADMIVAYDDKGKSSEERKEIQSKVSSIVSEARSLGDVQVDFSATHSQPGDGRINDLFGSAEQYEKIVLIKKKIDPFNRFRCHPFGSAL